MDHVAYLVVKPREMIDKALAHIVQELDAHLKAKLAVSEDTVILSGIMNQDGTVAIWGENKIVVSLVHVLEDRTIRMQAKDSSATALNLHMLVSAYYAAGNYTESLRTISIVMDFFRNKPVLNLPDAGEGSKGQIMVSLENTDIETMHNIWSMLGAKYMPCLLYRLRLQ